jgi:hypothetical protein
VLPHGCPQGLACALSKDCKSEEASRKKINNKGAQQHKKAGRTAARKNNSKNNGKKKTRHGGEAWAQDKVSMPQKEKRIRSTEF